VTRTNRAERQRLMERYGRNQPNGQFSAPAIDMLFPGVAARMFETLDELELDETFFKADTRVASKPAKAAKPAPAPEPVAQGEAPAPKPYSAMKKQELLELAAARGVEVSESDKKDEIVAALQQADEMPAEPAPAEDADEEDDGIGDMDDNLFK
jgi:hypothetical protein